MKLTFSLITIIFIAVVCTSCQTNSKVSEIRIKSDLPMGKILASNDVTISMAKDGSISLGSDKVDVADLLSKLKKRGIKKSDTIILKANQEARHEVLIKVLDQLAKGQYTNINVATEK